MCCLVFMKKAHSLFSNQEDSWVLVGSSKRLGHPGGGGGRVELDLAFHPRKEAAILPVALTYRCEKMSRVGGW